MTALRELRDKVAEGSFPDYISNRNLGWDVPILTPYEAFSGSLDAAKALHEALLPGYDWIIGRTNDGLTVHANVGSEAEAFDDCPARAWLLAILDALIAKEADDAGQ